jgi:hypothetical protein
MNYFLKQIYVGVLLSAISNDAFSQVRSAPRSPEGNAIPVTKPSNSIIFRSTS